MRIVILGSSGLLGKYLTTESIKRNYKTVGISRTKSDYNLDIRNFEKVDKVLKSIKPNVIINCIAITDLEYCEKYPLKAFLINTIPLIFLKSFCMKWNITLLQISTDHFFDNDKKKRHSENDKVKLLNQYARTKYAAEVIIKEYKKSLIVRTNFTGFKNYGDPTFIEWLINMIIKEKKLELFSDYYTSTIDAYTLSKFIFDVIEKKVYGIINLASSSVVSKKEFGEKIAKLLNKKITLIKKKNKIKKKMCPRAKDLGLDITKSKKKLKKHIPNLDEVCKRLIYEYNS